MRERVIELINEARRRGVIQQYAIGGAIGAMSEAIKKAVDVKFAQTKTRVFRPEHLAAIMIQTGRRIDLARLERFLEQVEMNQRYFRNLLRRHKLLRRWQAFLRQSST